jgi:xylulokinase
MPGVGGLEPAGPAQAGCVDARDSARHTPAEQVALGAARQAAWALSGAPDVPHWPPRWARTYDGDPLPRVRDQYAALRDDAAAWQVA